MEPPITLTQALAGEIRADLARLNETQTALCHATTMAKATASRRLSGESPFGLDELMKVADFLGVSVSDLLKRAEAQVEARASGAMAS